MKRKYVLLIAALALTLALAPATGNAIDTLTNFNSIVQIDPTSQAGVFTWNVDGTDHLFQQEWWLGVGTAPQTPINTFGLNSPPVTPGGNVAQYTFGNTAQNPTVTATYILLGGAAGSGTSDLGEQLRVTNTTAAAQTYRLFLYADFDLSNSLGGQTAVIEHTPEIDEADQFNNRVIVNSVVTPNAQHGEVNTFANTRNSLNSGVLIHLNDNFGPLTPADATWALEWDFSLGAGSSFLVSVDKHLAPIPLPPSVILLGSGLLGLVGLRRFRKN